MNERVFIITWLILGVISSLLLAVQEYRGKDTAYISDTDGLCFLICTIGGYISFTVAIFLLLNKSICKLMYKIANIRIRKGNE